MSTHKHSWVLMSSHENSWAFRSTPELLWALSSTHEHSWVWCHGNRSAHECYRRYVSMLMNAHECPWVLIAALGWSWAAMSRVLIVACEYSWAWLQSARRTHELSWCHGTIVIVMNANECSCVLMIAHGFILNSHESSWVPMSTHECQWTLRRAHECWWVIQSALVLDSLQNKKCQLFKRVPCSILTISWSRFNQIIKSWIFLKSTWKGLLKNVQDEISRPLGSREIQKTKALPVLRDTLYNIGY